MRRLTTPTHIFDVPFDTDIIQKCRIVYAQNEHIILTKEQCELSEQSIKVCLTQEETALFDCKKHYCEVQAHILTIDGKSLVSAPLRIAVEKCLDVGVLE